MTVLCCPDARERALSVHSSVGSLIVRRSCEIQCSGSLHAQEAVGLRARSNNCKLSELYEPSSARSLKCARPRRLHRLPSQT